LDCMYDNEKSNLKSICDDDT